MTTLLWLVAALGVVCIMLAVLLTASIYGWWKAEQECKQTRTAYWNERDGKIKEIDRLDKDLQGTRATIKARDIDIGRLVGEKEALRLETEKWQKLYGELVNTLHDAQGDAHATVPLQEAAPELVKRTRKKAGQA